MAPCDSDIYNSAVEKVSFFLDVRWSQRERGSEMSHYISDAFRDALINNSFNLPYVIITPLFSTLQNDRLQRNGAMVSPRKGLQGGPRGLGRERSA